MTPLKRLSNKQQLKGMTLQNKMFVLFGGICGLLIISLILIAMFGLPFLGIGGSYQARMAMVKKTITQVADHKKTIVEIWLNERHAELKTITGHNNLIHSLLTNGDNESLQAYFETHLQNMVTASPVLESMWLVNTTTGKTIATTLHPLEKLQADNFFQNTCTTPVDFSVKIVHSKDHNDCAIMFSQAIYLPDSKKRVAILIAKTNINSFLRPLLHKRYGLGETDEIILVNRHGTLLTPLINPLHGGETARSMETKLEGKAINSIVNGVEAFHHGTNYYGEKALSATRIIKAGDGNYWGIIVKQDFADAMASIYSRIKFLSFLGVAIFLSLLALIYLIAKQITKPLHELGRVAKIVSAGDLTARAQVTTHDEFELFATVFNRMVDQIENWHDELELIATEKTDKLNHAYLELQRREKQQQSLAEITQEYLNRGNLETALEQLTTKAVHLSGAQLGRFYYLANIDGKVKIVATSKSCWSKKLNSAENGNRDTIRALEQYIDEIKRSGSKIVDHLLQVKRPVLFDADQFQRTNDIPLPDNFPQIDSMMLVPVKVDKQIVAFISLTNRPGGFGHNEILEGDTFATKAALLIHAENRELARVAGEERSNSRNEFMANMSHELRTPLNIIIGMNQLLQRMDNSSVQGDYLTKIGFSAQQLLGLVNDVLDLSKVAVGQKLTIETVSFDPEELFYNVTQLLTFGQNNCKVELHADISRDIPHRLLGDARRLTQILNNLLSNALKFTPQGAITLKVVPLQKTDGQIVLDFSVTDTGIGMDKNQQEQVFEPFIQVDSSATRQYGGSGLGLPISQQLCQLLGGNLSVTSSLNEGSTFHFELPFQIDIDNDQPLKELLPAVNLHGLPLLVATDCPMCCDILQRMLKAMQFKVDIVFSSSGALELLQQAIVRGKPYQLLLIGQSLNEISGLAFAEQLATKSDLSELRRLLQVNPADLATISERRESLALNGLLPSPVRPSTLFDQILNAFGYSITTDQLPPELSMRWQAKVLLVEDNEMGRQMARALLENYGIEVVEAVNGAEAVAKIKTDEFDLVLMDIQMPIMDGLSATQKIRTLKTNNSDTLPIIAMTAHAFTENRAESLAAGMNGHITKPIEIETLHAELMQWLPVNLQTLTTTVPTDNASSNGELESALPEVDVAGGIRRVLGNKQTYLQMLKKFTQQYADTEIKLQHELDTEQQEAAILRVHTLKGVAGNLGATKLHKLAGQLEGELTKKENPATLSGMLAEQRHFLEALQLLSELQQLPEDNDKAKGSEQELRNILKQLLQPLETLQAQTVKPLLKQISAKSWPDEYQQPLTQIAEQVERYQFSTAAEQVHELLKDGEI